MQAIRTRYHGATNTKGAYFSAKTEFRLKKYHVDSHAEAAYAFANSLNWLARGETLVGGQFDSDYYWNIKEV